MNKRPYFERDNVHRLLGYSYGEQPDTVDIIKLNTNENPYPPGPAVHRALSGFDITDLRRYPAATAAPLRKALAQLHGVDPAQIVVTHAGDEALRLAMTTFVTPGHAFGMTDPSYSLYPVLAAIQDARVVSIPHPEDWSLPDDLGSRLNAAGAELTCIVNPHAPSGKLIPVAELAELAATLQGVLLIDEAYVDFVDPALHYSAVPLLERCDNVLLMRTFSKGYALAGLRLGYLMGSPSLIDPIMSKTRDSYNIDAISQRLGLAAVTDQAYARSTWDRVRSERERQTSALRALGFEPVESQANFLLARVPAAADAETLYRRLKADNILVRYFDHPRLEHSLRITIGTPEENARLNAALAHHLSTDARSLTDAH